ncbi:MAG: VCBS repeat-containing protein, partial [Deltaproteobacteria bacterium]
NADGYADVVIGAPGVSSGVGRAYVFLGGPAGLNGLSGTTLVGPDGAGANFGASVAGAGDVNGDGYADVFVGAYTASTSVGAAHLYLGGAGGVSTSIATTITGPAGAGGYFGTSVACAGDVNGDGYADLVAGADNVGSGVGAAYVFHGGASGVSSTPSITLAGLDGPGAFFGRAASSAGDVDGDGYGDLVVGAPGVAASTGRIYVYPGGATGLTVPGAGIAGPSGAGGSFGESVAGAGDVNGDHLADVIVGAHSASAGEGAAFLFLGAAAGVAPAAGVTPGATLASPAGPGGFFGIHVAFCLPPRRFRIPIDARC